MKIFYVRHGQTEHNKNGILTGRANVSLSEKGKAQAAETAEKLKNIKFDAMFCSPLQRAKQTIEEINKFHNQSVIFDDRLIERDYGDFTNKSTTQIEREKSWNYYKCDEKYPTIESPKQIMKRVKSFIDEKKALFYDKTILIVAHSGVGRLFSCYFNGIPKNGDLLNMSISNAEVIVFETK